MPPSVCNLDENLKMPRSTTGVFCLPPSAERHRRHADVTLNLIQGSIGLFFPDKIVSNGSMFATRGSLHAHTFTSFECSLSKDPLSAKKNKRGSFRNCYCLVRVQSGYCSALVTVRPIGLHETRVSFEPLRPSLYAWDVLPHAFFSSSGVPTRTSPRFTSL